MLKAAIDAGREADGFRADNLEICLKAALGWLLQECHSGQGRWAFDQEYKKNKEAHGKFPEG